MSFKKASSHTKELHRKQVKTFKESLKAMNTTFIKLQGIGREVTPEDVRKATKFEFTDKQVALMVRDLNEHNNKKH